MTTTTSNAAGVTLFPHQLTAVQWMQRTERRPRMVPEQPHGGILAHEMGLGKTITCLSLMSLEGVGNTIVVCPKSVITQWLHEATRVLNLPARDIIVFHGAHREVQQQARDDADASPRKKGSVLVLTTFDIVRMDLQRKGRGGSWIHGQFWDRVVLDEAHRICEQSSQTARAIRSLRGRNRWCVTGTPFKNGVTDLVALSKFLMVPPYCNTTWWRTHSSNPHKIREWRNMFVHMQAKHVLSLPALDSRVQFVTSSALERAFAQQLSEGTSLSSMPPLVADADADADVAADVDGALQRPHHGQEYELLRIMRLRQTANHPLLLHGSSVIALRLVTAPPSSPSPSHACDACGDASSSFSTEPCGHSLCPTCRASVSPAAAAAAEEADVSGCICCVAAALPVTRSETRPSAFWRHSSKTQALADYLVHTLRRGGGDAGSKVVLFSQWTTCLDLLAGLLSFLEIGYAMFDGRVNSLEEREATLTRFKTDPACEVLLTSLGAGGEGLNLTFANHIILMEPYWNLAAEQQAIDRLFRIGQTRVTHVLRLCVDDSIENWVRTIQINKEIELRRLMFGGASVDGSPPLSSSSTTSTTPVVKIKKVTAAAATPWRECKRPRVSGGGEGNDGEAATTSTTTTGDGGAGTLQSFLWCLK